MNLSLKIKSLKINSIRGIKELELVLNGKGLILYGENGTGKSSIVDALEFFFSGEIEHISKIKSLSIKKHLPHIHSSYKNVDVTIEFIPGSVQMTRNISKKMEVPDHMKKYFNDMHQGRFILRRHQILEFIYSQPAERFEAISQVLGIDYINNIESILQKTHDQLESQIVTKENMINNIQDFLSSYLEIKIKNAEEILQPLNNLLTKNGFPTLSCMDDIDDYLNDLLKNNSGHIQNTDSPISSLSKISAKLDSITLEHDSDKIVILKNQLGVLHLVNDTVKLELLDFLKLGKRLMENQPQSISVKNFEQSKCPFCESDIDRTIIINKITNRLEDIIPLFEGIDEIKQIIQYLSNRFDIIINNINNLGSDLKNKITDATDFIPDLKTLEGIVENITILKNDIQILVTKKQEFDDNQFYVIMDTLKNTILKIQNKIDLLLKIHQEPKQQQIIKIFSILQQVKTKYGELIKLDNELSQLKNSCHISDILCNTYSKVKKQKIQQIHEDIEQDIEKFYTFIHRGEQYNDIKLLLDSEKKGSTEIKISSLVDESYTDPRAFQSEGHLDSLGLCIFLAFVKKFNTSIDLIVLDDVVTTIDSQHRMRICELMYENFKDKQMIITTHDNIWFEQLESYQNKYNIRNDFLNLKIDNWSLENGPKLSIYNTREERIKAKIQNHEKNSLGNEIRQYFEYVLKDICQNLIAEVPFRPDGKYMIDELFNASKKRIQKLIKDSSWKTKIFEIYKQIEGIRFLTNILSHDNLEILQISMSEIEYLYESIKELENKFKCPECLKSLEYDRRGSLLRCINPKCRNRLILQTI